MADGCQVLRLSRAGYYRWPSGEVSPRAAENRRIAELVKEIHAESPDNEKWLTDVTEFKYYVASTVHKVYLSAILDLFDRRIVAAVIRDANDNALVHETFDRAVAENPDAHPLFHSDRGFQYTTRVFHDKLAAAGMTQSMSIVGNCIDNGPMEDFWGILKRERYYGPALHRPGGIGTDDRRLHHLL